MNRIIHIVILCLWGFVAGVRAQTSLQELIDKMSDSDRKEYFDNARNYIEYTYYNQLFATLSNRDAYAYVVEDLMAESNVQCKPEILWKGGERRYLSPMEYMYCLNREYRELNTDELEFTVSNINFSPEIRPYSVSGFRVWADYDLEVRYQNCTLLKRRCRMYCLFPKYYVATRVRLLQVEPLKDLAMPQPVSAVAAPSDEERYNEAVHWYELKQKDMYLPIFRELAEREYTEAEWMYGVCLHDEKKFDEAVYWYRRAVKKNHAKSQNSLGYCYSFGEGVKKDSIQALVLYKKSAEQGCAQAQCNLGICYATGYGVTLDEAKAINLLSQSAGQGHWGALCALGLYFEFYKELNAAVECYTKAAEQGYSYAQYNLGLCYEYGDGLNKNLNKAVYWYLRSALQGYVEAKHRLGNCYKYGVGVAKDLGLADDLFKFSYQASIEDDSVFDKVFKRIIYTDDFKVDLTINKKRIILYKATRSFKFYKESGFIVSYK